MSIDRVKHHFAQWDRQGEIMEFETSSATVEEAASTIGVIPARIAKTLSFRSNENSALLIVTSGEAKIDNKKFRETFAMKARMLSADEVIDQTGHAIGGVCPFGLKNQLDVYLDVSLKRFETIFPACGSSNSAIELTIEELETFSLSKNWVDVCKGWEEETLAEHLA